MPQKFHFETVPVKEVARKRLRVEPDQHRPVVLIVDDEHLIADSLAIILTGKGYATMAAYDAESALDLAIVIPPELLISDVALPGMSGIDLAIAIKQNVRDCKVLLFSGQAASIDLLATARDAGHDFTLLSKPIHPTELLVRISELNLGPRFESGTAREDRKIAAIRA